MLSSLFGLGTSEALVILFVLLPFVLAAIIVPLVAWRSRGSPKPVLTSDILAHGEPGRARIVAVRNMGTLVDVRPMIRFSLEVRAAGQNDSFGMEVVQAVPRSLVRDYKPGQIVDVRFTPDRTAGAIVLGTVRST
jgi:hypothetical protein